MRKYWLESENTLRKKSLDAGVTFVTDVNKESFAKALKPLYGKLVRTSEQTALMNELLAIK